MKKKIILLSILLASISHYLSAQSETGYFSLDTVEVTKPNKPAEHLLGLRYGVAFTNIFSTPDLKSKGVFSPVNVAVVYTYYHPLWGYLDYFGLQTGIKYGSAGYTTLANTGGIDQTITAMELPLLSAFTVNVGKRVRILASLGMYLGYHLTTTREKGWDCYDKRFDFGVLGSAGLGIKLHPIELHLEGGFQYAMTPLFDQQRQSSIYWMDIHPYQIFINLGIHYHF